MSRIAIAAKPQELDVGRQMWREYAKMIGDPAWLPGIESELADIGKIYAPPGGTFVLAYEGQEPAGCGGLRRIDDDLCEMARVFVRPQFRGHGIARSISVALMGEARRIGYGAMRFAIPGVLASMMTGGIKLYESLGFRPIPLYGAHPAGTVCMEARVRSGARK
jgi:GNAT superfamily N-acetyltransferase